MYNQRGAGKLKWNRFTIWMRAESLYRVIKITYGARLQLLRVGEFL